MIKCFTAGNWIGREWNKKMFVNDKLQLMDINNTKTSKDNLNLTACRTEDIGWAQRSHEQGTNEYYLTSEHIPLIV